VVELIWKQHIKGINDDDVKCIAYLLLSKKQTIRFLNPYPNLQTIRGKLIEIS